MTTGTTHSFLITYIICNEIAQVGMYKHKITPTKVSNT